MKAGDVADADYWCLERELYLRKLVQQIALGPLLDVVGELGTEERAVLLVLARRLLLGQRTIGLLRVATDGRDWLRERSEELQDVLIYTAIAEVAATTRGEP
jgi:hypothetical protein